MDKIDALFDQRYAADEKLRDAVVQGKVSKATFRNYYGLKASITSATARTMSGTSCA